MYVTTGKFEIFDVEVDRETYKNVIAQVKKLCEDNNVKFNYYQIDSIEPEDFLKEEDWQKAEEEDRVNRKMAEGLFSALARPEVG